MGKVFLIDTPGLCNTDIDDTEIVKSLVDWLQYVKLAKFLRIHSHHYRHHPDRMLGGVIYLHEISISHVAFGRGDHVALAKLLCGDYGLINVVLVTTKWGEVAADKGVMREQELASKYWREMMQNGSTMARFNLTRGSAWEIIDSLLSRPPIPIHSLQDQRRSFIEEYTAVMPKANVFGLFQGLSSTIHF